MCRHFGTLCSEMSAHKIQTRGNHAEERIQHSEHGESLKSRLFFIIASTTNERAEGLNFMSSFVSLINHICVFGSTFYGIWLATMEYGAETSSLSAQHNGNKEKGRK